MTRTAALALVAAVTMAAGCQTVGPTTEQVAMIDGAEKLNGNTLATYFSTVRTHDYTAPDDSGGQVSYFADGTAGLKTVDGREKGTWRLDGDRFCSTWERTGDGAEACFSIYRNVDGSFSWFLADGSLGLTSTETP